MENVGIEPLFLFPKQECTTITLRSPWKGVTVLSRLELVQSQLHYCYGNSLNCSSLPSRQIFSVPRFCQQITGAITTSRLEGLTSGLRITHTAVPLNARHSRCPRRIGADGWTRTNDIPPGAVLYRLSYVCMRGCRPFRAARRLIGLYHTYQSLSILF